MKCGNCTLCCTLLKVDKINKPAGVMCKHCSTKCDIYKDRPKACKEFTCAYYQMNKVSERLRPNNCGVIFEKLEDDLMFGIINPNHKDFKYINGQITAFLQEGINVVLSKYGQPVVYHIDNVSPESVLSRVYKIAEK